MKADLFKEILRGPTAVCVRKVSPGEVPDPYSEILVQCFPGRATARLVMRGHCNHPEWNSLPDEASETNGGRVCCPNGKPSCYDAAATDFTIF